MKTLQELQEMYNADKMANQKSLLEYIKAREYYHGDQLPQDVIALLNERRQPIIHENLFKMIINKILGYKSQNIQEIKVAGRQEQDRNLANILQDLLRVFTQEEAYDREIMKRDLELIYGLSVLELWVELDKEQDVSITLKSLPADTFLIDKYSIEPNASDATRFHKCINMDYFLARDMFKNIVRVQDRLVDTRVDLIESWILEYSEELKRLVWNRYIWQNNANIVKFELSPFKNGKHPFVVAKFYSDHEGRWYGLFRDIKPLQDYINYAENKVTNMMGTFKVFFEDGAADDLNSFARAASVDNAIIKVKDGSLQNNRIRFEKNNADISMLSQKIQEMRVILKQVSGLNDEALGTATNRQSALAISARRDVGLLGLNAYMAISDNMDKELFKKVLDLIQHYFTKRQVFRIVDKKTGERYFSINDNKDNHIKIGKFDLVLSNTPKMQGREERFAHWSEIFKTIASVDADLARVVFPLMLKDTESPIIADIEEAIANLEKQKQEQAQAQQPFMQQQEQLANAKSQAELAEIQSKANKNQAQSLMIEKQADILAGQANFSKNLQQGLNLSQNGANNAFKTLKNANRANKPRGAIDYLNDVKRK